MLAIILISAPNNYVRMTGPELSRRRLLQASAALGIAGTIPSGVAAESSPHLEKFVQPMPIPEVLEPDGRRRGADYYEVSMEEFERKVHPDLPPTTFWGFEGTVPGPVIKARSRERIKVRFDNTDLPSEHLLEIDERVGGTKPEDYDDHDGPVPDVRTVVHQHGLNIPWQSDGQALSWKSPDGVTGPRYVKDVHDIPNRQGRTTTTYHDHALGISRLNNYAGLHGFYIIEGLRERFTRLPRGDYDIPIMLQDKTFESDGSLHYPDEFIPNFAGDTAFVNGAVWPYLEVEPRRYRFRLVNQSNGRTFSLSLARHEDGHDGGHAESAGHVPTMYQIAPDHGFLEDVVAIGHGGDMESLTIAPFERAEIVVDFSDHAGETFTVTNDAEFPFAGGGHDGGGGHDDGGDGDHDAHLGEVFQLRVTDPDHRVRDRSADPRKLRLPRQRSYNEHAVQETRHMTMGMKMVDGLPTHVLNGKTFHDGGEIAKPQLGTTEIWELENNTMHTHPIHVHLIDFEVIGRGPDGTDDPLPNERGSKDVVRVNPGETVRIITRFGDYTGKFPWHCHILEHEEQSMMRMFEVVTGRDDDDERGRDRDDERGRDRDDD